MRIHLDFILPTWAKRSILVGTFLFVGGTGVALAAPKFRFSAGAPVSASQVNETLDDLDARLARLETSGSSAKVCSGTFNATKGVGCTVEGGGAGCISACRFVEISGGGAAEYDIRPGMFNKTPRCVASPVGVDGSWISSSGNSPNLGSVRFGPTTGVGVTVICTEPN
jgi:hypothetical protein